MQVDSGQIIYENGLSLTLNLFRNQPWKPNHNFCTNQLQMDRTWSMTANFPISLPGFQLRTKQRKPNKIPKATV